MTKPTQFYDANGNEVTLTDRPDLRPGHHARARPATRLVQGRLRHAAGDAGPERLPAD